MVRLPEIKEELIASEEALERNQREEGIDKTMVEDVIDSLGFRLSDLNIQIHKGLLI